MAYRSEHPTDRWKAIAAVAAVHAVLGALIISGLNVDMVREAVDRLQSFDVTPEPPPPEVEPPQVTRDRAEQPEGESGARPTEIVAPQPEIPVPTNQPVTAAPVAGSGMSSSSGSGTSGIGPGAGAGGSGSGGGGSGAGNTPARLVRNITRSDYRQLTGGRMVAGSAGLALGIGPSGRITSCTVEHPSGDPAIDAGICAFAASRLRFEPARDARGRPIPYFVQYMARWRR